MNRQIPSYLRLFTDTTEQPPAALNEDVAALAAACAAFSEATGWQLACDTRPTAESKSETDHAPANLMWSAPVDPGVGIAPGHIRIFEAPRSDSESAPLVTLERAINLASAIGGLWDELLTTRRALREREAELATAVPLVLEADEAADLSRRLEAVLRAGAEGVDCQAAELYLLDAATSELKLRSSWGLPEGRFVHPARPLRGAMADLEALLGHAVVMSDKALFEYWKVPDGQFGACVCVPVASANMPLGTLWIYSRTERDFTPSQTNIVEVVAGRIAVELERQMLADEARRSRMGTSMLASAEAPGTASVPNVAPSIDNWQLAGRARQQGHLPRAFCDWFANEGESLSIVAAVGGAPGNEGALCVASMRAAARSLGDVETSPQRTLWTIGRTLWSTSTGTQYGGMFRGTIAAGRGECVWAAAGPVRVMRVSRSRSVVAKLSQTALGESEQVEAQDSTTRLAVGEIVLVIAAEWLQSADEQQLAAIDASLSDALSPSLALSAERLADIAAQTLEGEPGDYGLIVIKRRHD